MSEKPDALLLREYAEQGHDDAFCQIVVRYTDLVYSAAFRQLDSREVAQDVTQSVFTDLARKAQSVADRLSADASLVGWFYRSTRFAALKHLRDDHRRAAHERQAMEHLMTDSESAPEWERIRPILDEAMTALSDDERDAVLLRFFKNHDFRAVGVALGISDDAAQKRVSRAVERLREVFAKRGVTVGAGGLAAVLTANAVQAAPAGMAVAISSAAALAGTTVAASTISTATKAIAMTTLQKAIVTTALVVAAGAGIYKAHRASRWHAQNESLLQQQARLNEQIQKLQDDKNGLAGQISSPTNIGESTNGASDELLRLRAEVTRLRNEAGAAAVETADARKLESEYLQIISNVPPVRTLLSTTSTRASWDQAILTGGWKTPSGTRAMAITTFQPVDNANTINIKTSILEYPDDAGKTLGLDQFNVDDQSATKANTVTRDQAAATINAAHKINGVNVLVQPEVTLESGRMAEVSVVDMHQIASGEKYSTGPVIDFIPTISPDGQSVQMVIASHLNYLVSPEMFQPPPN